MIILGSDVIKMYLLMKDLVATFEIKLIRQLRYFLVILNYFIK